MRARGFSLIELVITIVIIGIVAAVGAPMLSSGLLVFNAATVEFNTLAKERYAMERIVRELRAINYNTAAASYNVTLASVGANTITFTKTDGVQVTLNGSAPPALNITYAPGGGPAVLTDQLAAAGLAFTGYQADGVTTTTNAGNMAFIDVSLALLRPPANATSFARVTRVQLRDRQ